MLYVKHTGICSRLISLYIVQPPVPCYERHDARSLLAFVAGTVCTQADSMRIKSA
jgi:hypothetical protein